MSSRTLPPETIEALTSRLGGTLREHLAPLAGLAQEVESQMREELDALSLPAAESEARTPAPLARAISALRSGDGQASILRALVAGCSTLGARTALLVIRPDHLEVWEATGFEDAGREVAGMRVGRDDPAINQALADGDPVLADGLDGPPAPEFGQGARDAALLAPLLVHGKAAALLYADAEEADKTLDRAGVEALVEVAGLAVERLSLSRALGLSTKPGSRPGASAAPPAARQAPEAEAARPIRASADRLSESAAAPSSGLPEAPAGGGLPPAPGGGGLPPSPASDAASNEESEPSGGFDFGDEPAAAPAQAPGTFGGADIPVAPGPVEDEGERMPTGPIKNIFGTDKQEDARRYARLLMQDICLYHAAAVEEGRQNRDLLARLGDEIDRARKSYEERIAEDVREQGEFFEEALVEVLAEGDRAALA